MFETRMFLTGKIRRESHPTGVCHRAMDVPRLRDLVEDPTDWTRYQVRGKSKVTGASHSRAHVALRAAPCADQTGVLKQDLTDWFDVAN